MQTLQRFRHSSAQLVLFVTTFGLLALAELAPARFEHAMREDGWAEWATFCAFLLAAAGAADALWITRGQRRSQRQRWLALAGLCAFCIFVAGEEISWGQRLLGFRPPALFLENNHQQESNFHNLLKGIFDTRWMVFAVAALYGVVAPYLVHLMRFGRAFAAPRALIPWFVLVAWLEFSYPYELIGEQAELVLGLLFLCDVLERRRALHIDRSRASLRPAAYQAAALAGAVLCLPLNELSLLENTPELLTHTRSDLATLAKRFETGDTLRRALFRKREVHKRLYTAVKAGYIDLERERFYLDAWNSPYWIAFERTGDDRGRVLLYSFGPNRRRDLDPAAHTGGDAAGDDVAVTVEVTLSTHAMR